MSATFARLLSTGALAFMLASPTSGLAEAVTLRFATFEPPTTPVSVMFQTWIDQVNAASEGALDIQFFPGGALGRDPRTQLELVQNGVTDIAFGFPFLTPNKFPDDMVTTLPLIIANAHEGTYAHWRLYERGLLRGWDDVVPLMLCTPSPVNVLSTEEVADLSSLSGLRGSATSPIAQEILTALGAVPVSGFNFSNAAEAMSRGQLDFDLIGFMPASVFRQIEVATSALMIPLGASPCAVFMNRDVYEGLPEAARAVLDEHRGMPLGLMWADVIDSVESTVRAQFVGQEGNSINELTDEQVARATEVTQPIVDAWIASNPNGTALVGALREEVEALRNGAEW
ncbi:type 2 periplasmic-binding domain-containing protein [Pararhodobacter aggregans]